jgi:PAS domain-containing protein
LADFDRKFLLINQAYAKFAEVEEKDVIGTSSLVNSWLPKEIIAKNLSKVREVIENKEVIVRERMINPGRSDESYWDVTKFPVFNDQGDVVAVGGISMDITAQKKGGTISTPQRQGCRTRTWKTAAQHRQPSRMFCLLQPR